MSRRDINRLLALLDDAERRRWRRELEPVRLTPGQVLETRERPSVHAWFPVSATVSMMNTTRDGASGELALIGNEGLVGHSLIPGVGMPRCCAIVSDGGDGFRIETSLVDAEFERGGSIAQGLLAFTEALIAQIAQLVLCNRHHLIEQQLGRLLLTSLDRVVGGELQVTHEGLAARLGVRREAVTTAARALKRAGAIDHRRGRIEVLDRTVLERRSCECYAVIAAEYDRLLR